MNLAHLYWHLDFEAGHAHIALANLILEAANADFDVFHPYIISDTAIPRKRAEKGGVDNRYRGICALCYSSVMKSLNASNEFVVGKHSIAWVDPDFVKNFKDSSFETPPANVKTIRFQKLPRYMTDKKIETELTPGICTLADVLNVLESRNVEFRDGNWNIFYFPGCVVFVRWYSGGSGWRVDAWQRDDNDWYAVSRVFSPATESSDSQNSRTLEPSDTLPSELTINGQVYRRV